LMRRRPYTSELKRRRNEPGGVRRRIGRRGRERSTRGFALCGGRIAGC